MTRTHTKKTKNTSKYKCFKATKTLLMSQKPRQEILTSLRPPLTSRLQDSSQRWIVTCHYYFHSYCMTTAIHLAAPNFNRVWNYQIRSVAQSCQTLCNPMNRSTPGLPVHHQLPEFTQTHIHQVSDAIQPFHPLSSPFPPVPNPSQHQSLFQWVNSLHEVAKHQSFQRSPRTDLL